MRIENNTTQRVNGQEASKDIVGLEQIKYETSEVVIDDLTGKTIDRILKKAEEVEMAVEQVEKLDGSNEEIRRRTELVDKEIKTVKEGAIENIEHVAEYHELSDLLGNPKKIKELDLELLQSQTRELRGSQRKFNSVFKSEVLKTSNKTLIKAFLLIPAAVASSSSFSTSHWGSDILIVLNACFFIFPSNK